MTNAKRLTFIWKRQTVSGKRGENLVTWSLLLFAVNAMLNLPIPTRFFSRALMVREHCTHSFPELLFSLPGYYS